MKCVIKGLLYDTDKATAVAADCTGHQSPDGHFYEVTIYITKKGAWFIEGEHCGGEMFPPVVDGGVVTNRSDIRPISKDEARKWLELNRMTKSLERCRAHLIMAQ